MTKSENREKKMSHFYLSHYDGCPFGSRYSQYLQKDKSTVFVILRNFNQRLNTNYSKNKVAKIWEKEYCQRLVCFCYLALTDLSK